MLDIDFRWIDAGSSVDQLSSVTMAELKITVDDLALTTHVDRHSHSRSIRAPLYPIAEWLAAWWWPLFYEHGEWNIGTDSGYLKRHDLSYAAPGFALPSVVLQPTGRFLDVRARRSTPTYSSVEFLTEGTRSIPVADTQAHLTEFIAAVVDRLHEREVEGTALQADWAAISDLRDDEQTFSRLAGSFGLDPFDTNEADATAISDLADTTEMSLLEDLLSLAPPTQATAVLESIRRVCQDVERQDSPGTWADLASAAPDPSPSLTPWQAGYETARWLRSRLQLDGQPVAFEGNLAVPTVDLHLDRSRLTGIVSSRSPACALRARPAVARRFAVARSIGGFLLRATAGPALLTTMKTDRQARSRSFAAELLAPAQGLRDRLGGQSGWIESETVDEVAEEFEVSSFVVCHQIENHGLGHVTY